MSVSASLRAWLYAQKQAPLFSFSGYDELDATRESFTTYIVKQEDDMEVRTSAGDLVGETAELLARLGVEPELVNNGEMETHSPITGEIISRVKASDAASTKVAIARRGARRFARGE